MHASEHNFSRKFISLVMLHYGEYLYKKYLFCSFTFDTRGITNFLGFPCACLANILVKCLLIKIILW